MASNKHENQDKKIDFKFSVSPKNKTTQLKKFGALIFEK